MEHEEGEGAFDLAGFLKLLGEVMPQSGTGVLSEDCQTVGAGCAVTTRPGRLLLVEQSPRDFPRRIAPNVQLVAVQPGRHAVTVELDLQRHLIPPHPFAAHRAGLTDARSAEPSIRPRSRQRAATDRFSGFLLKESLVVQTRHVLLVHRAPDETTRAAGGLGRSIGAEGLPALVAIGASAVAAGNPDLVQVSRDRPSRLGIHFAETVGAASRHATQKHAELV